MDVSGTGGLQGIVFDKDGTLFDFATTWEAWAKAFLLRLSNGDRGQAARAGATIGFDLEQSRFAPDSIVIANTPEAIARALLPVFDGLSVEALRAVLDHEAARAPQSEAVPLRPLLGDLRGRGLRLGVATNDSEAPARAHLESAGVTDLFDFIAGSDSGHGGKPQPGQLLAFAHATGCAPTRCAMVGDSLHDLRAGRAAGMCCVGVLTGMAARSTLAPLADVVLDDIGQLPAWLDGTFTPPGR